MEKDLENVSKLTSETNTRAIDDLAELIRKGKNV
jgi:hypothetical protein